MFEFKKKMNNEYQCCPAISRLEYFFLFNEGCSVNQFAPIFQTKIERGSLPSLNIFLDIDLNNNS